MKQESLLVPGDLDGDELPQNPEDDQLSKPPPDDDDSEPPPEIIKVLEIVERDSIAIAQSYTSLFSSLRLALSQVTSSSVEHMQCFNDAAGRVQESALDAATRGNRYINSCLRLNEEMKGTENLAMRLKMLRRSVDTLDSVVNKLTRLP